MSKPLIPPSVVEVAKFPTIQEFCIKIPLYKDFQVTEMETSDLYALFAEAATIDFFCVDCNVPSTFSTPNAPLFDVRGASWMTLADRVVTRECVCTREANHKAYFQFRLKASHLSKIGQSPSLADISTSDLLPYRKVLTKEDYQELTKAVGLAAHGIGIGSFVYLRRIFERLINEAKLTAATDHGWNESDYKKARMDEKIGMLHAFLPNFLVEEKKLYSIISRGIHSLSEQDCLTAFPVIRTGIELILDEKVLAKQRQDKITEAKKGLGTLRTKLAAALEAKDD